MSRILPCPFCSYPSSFLGSPELRERKLYAVGCSNQLCNVLSSTKWFMSEEDALKAWNHRFVYAPPASSTHTNYCKKCGKKTPCYEDA